GRRRAGRRRSCGLVPAGRAAAHDARQAGTGAGEPRALGAGRLAALLERGQLLGRHRVGVLRLGEAAGANIVDGRLEGVSALVADLGVALDEPGRGLREAEQVVPNEDLAVAAGGGA